MIHRAEDIVHVASATVARWQAEALEIIQARQASLQLGQDRPIDWAMHRRQEQQGRP